MVRIDSEGARAMVTKKKTVIAVKKDSKGRHYWHCDLPWWVPHESLELTASAFTEGTEIAVTEPVVVELKKQSDD